VADTLRVMIPANPKHTWTEKTAAEMVQPNHDRLLVLNGGDFMGPPLGRVRITGASLAGDGALLIDVALDSEREPGAVAAELEAGDPDRAPGAPIEVGMMFVGSRPEQEPPADGEGPRVHGRITVMGFTRSSRPRTPALGDTVTVAPGQWTPIAPGVEVRHDDDVPRRLSFDGRSVHIDVLGPGKRLEVAGVPAARREQEDLTGDGHNRLDPTCRARTAHMPLAPDPVVCHRCHPETGDTR
jgi:hypothetical protein